MLPAHYLLPVGHKPSYVIHMFYDILLQLTLYRNEYLHPEKSSTWSKNHKPFYSAAQASDISLLETEHKLVYSLLNLIFCPGPLS